MWEMKRGEGNFSVGLILLFIDSTNTCLTAQHTRHRGWRWGPAKEPEQQALKQLPSRIGKAQPAQAPCLPSCLLLPHCLTCPPTLSVHFCCASPI